LLAGHPVRAESKTDFGYAVVEEVLSDMIASQWVIPLRESTDVLDTAVFDMWRDSLRLTSMRAN